MRFATVNYQRLITRLSRPPGAGRRPGTGKKFSADAGAHTPALR
jgi:hypothetical protein